MTAVGPEAAPRPLAGPTAPPAVEIEGVTRSHRGRRGAEPVLANDGISLTVHPGEVFGLLGPNGAGKTTLVRQIVGALHPDAGRIRVLGHDITADPRRAPRLLAYLGQDEPALRELPVGLAVETTGRLRGLSRAEARSRRDVLLDELGIGEVHRRPLLALSGGQRRLAHVAAALIGERPLLVLDEPTTGLDPVARRAVWAALDRRRAAGATVVLVTHNVLEAETVLDRVAVLDRGRVIACDTPGRLKAMVSDEVRLDLVWRGAPAADDPTVALLALSAVVSGRRWSIRLPREQAREALGRLTAGPALESLDDFTLATPSLEDVYLALGGRDRDLERG
ncbi:MAG: ABC transporter ATP-binding protein [Actinomycetota bacterium]|nr:ABC transporter ATP-binding protein [Actinomycetota bacterium]